MRALFLNVLVGVVFSLIGGPTIGVIALIVITPLVLFVYGSLESLPRRARRRPSDEGGATVRTPEAIEPGTLAAR
jgi:hypothetical protein